MNTKYIKIVGVVILIAVLGFSYKMYSDSVDEDFNNISRTETYRIGDHYTGQYHRPGCPKLQQAYKGGIRYESSKDAKDDGYSACKRCDPDGPDE